MEYSLSAALAEVARLADGDEDPTEVFHRLVQRAVSLVPGATAGSLTVATPDGGLATAASDERVGPCHDVQFRTGGDGPARETLRHNEPRRVDDMAVDDRWPAFRATARRQGFASCLALPLLTARHPSAALNLYADQPGVFAGTAHDVALFFAAQGGVALDNADLYRQSRHLVEHLHRALTSHSIVERARGLLMGRYHIDSEEAFALLRTESQRSHRKLRDIAAAVLDEHDPLGGSSTGVAWNPVRHRAPIPRPLADDPSPP